jgi:hypothetical protein
MISSCLELRRSGFIRALGVLLGLSVFHHHATRDDKVINLRDLYHAYLGVVILQELKFAKERDIYSENKC